MIWKLKKIEKNKFFRMLREWYAQRNHHNRNVSKSHIWPALHFTSYHHFIKSTIVNLNNDFRPKLSGSSTTTTKNENLLSKVCYTEAQKEHSKEWNGIRCLFKCKTFSAYFHQKEVWQIKCVYCVKKSNESISRMTFMKKLWIYDADVQF